MDKQEQGKNNGELDLFWEDGYKNKTISTMGGPSVEVYEMSALLGHGERVLDLGCGEGRNAIYLAQKGCDVTAVDISVSGIEKVIHASKALGVHVKGVVCDLNDFAAEEEFDVVLAHSSLHFLTREKWRSLLEELKQKTRPGGMHSLTVLIPTDQYPFEGPLLTNGHKNSFAIHELKDFYNDWEIIRYDCYLKQDQHPGIPIHSHYTEKIVCRKKTSREEKKLDYEYKSLYSGPDDPARELFDQVHIGDDEKTICKICGKPKIINEVNLGRTMGSKSIIEDDYIIKDLFYGKTAFQLINGSVRGKYIYESEPVRIHFHANMGED